MGSSYLVGHLDQLGSRADGRAGDDAAVLENLSRLDDDDVELAVGLVLGVVPLQIPLAKPTHAPHLGEPSCSAHRAPGPQLT